MRLLTRRRMRCRRPIRLLRGCSIGFIDNNSCTSFNSFYSSDALPSTLRSEVVICFHICFHLIFFGRNVLAFGTSLRKVQILFSKNKNRAFAHRPSDGLSRWLPKSFAEWQVSFDENGDEVIYPIADTQAEMLQQKIMVPGPQTCANLLESD